MSYTPIKNEIFHVHSYRCKHASNEPDIDYVRKAIELGAKRIVFTDHTPFPGNPFPARMNYEQLPEYINSIGTLKEQFADKIEILCGLEVEWLPSYENYYNQLRKMEGIDLLIIGQHFCESLDGTFNAESEDRFYDYVGLSQGVCEGIKSGLFDIVAHPDRSFRGVKEWGEEQKSLAQTMIDAAFKNGKWNGIYFEWNYASSTRKNCIWDEFWKMIPSPEMIVIGLDAHSVENMETGYLNTRQNKFLCK